MRRLNDPVYRHRPQQFLADAVLVAIACALAFVLRFVDAGGIPERYRTLLWQSIAFVALGKALIFTLLGLHQKWWRYFGPGDFPAILRAVALASAALVVVFTVAPAVRRRPAAVDRDLGLHPDHRLLAGARIVTPPRGSSGPSKAAREPQATRVADRRRRRRAARWSSARCS